MNDKKNLLSAIVLQIVTIAQGMILPRLIISHFGSEINGLVSSITYFLSFISLLEGGIGAVVLAELYKPIEDRDDIKILSILYSCKRFFCRLTYVFIAYVIILSVVYPVFFNSQYNPLFVGSLIIVMCITTVAQYMFAITMKILLQAQQRVFIVNSIASLCIVINLLLSIISLHFYPSIHIMKLIAGYVYVFQPIALNLFIDKKYRNLKGLTSDYKNYDLKNKRDGFAQNLAYFITSNIPVILITAQGTLIDVSIYTVHMLAINALRSFVISISSSYQSSLGKYYTQGDVEQLNTKFSQFEQLLWDGSCVLFSTCLILINAFVGLYTVGVSDANYFRPDFAIVIVIANMLFSIREPYRLLVLSAGKFRETTASAIIEVIINLLFSVVLYRWLGLLSVALGCLFSVVYRGISLMCYIDKNILFRKKSIYFECLLSLFIMLVINVVAYSQIHLETTSVIHFVVAGCVVVALEVVTYTLIRIVSKRMLKLICHNVI